MQSMPWLESLSWFSGSHSNNATDEAFDAFYAQSVLIPEHTPLTEKVVRDYFEAMWTAEVESSQVRISISAQTRC